MSHSLQHILGLASCLELRLQIKDLVLDAQFEAVNVLTGKRQIRPS